MVTPDEILAEIINAGGLMADSAKVFENAPREIKREFILNFKQQAKEARLYMVEHFGEALVIKIENFF